MDGTYFAFPFLQIGQALRSLSLSGAAGNVAAWAVYVLIGVIPCAVFLVLLWKKKMRKLDLFLLALSVLLFVVMYYMINPGLFGSNVAGEAGVLCGAAFDSVLCTYLVLRVLFLCRNAKAGGLQKWFSGVLYVAVVFLLVAILVECAVWLPQTIGDIRAGNSATVSQTIGNIQTGIGDGGVAAGTGIETLALTYAFCALHAALNVLLYVLDILVLRKVILVAKTYQKDAWSEEMGRNVEQLTKICTVNLVVSVISVMAFNLLQLCCHGMLYRIDMVVVVPVFSVLLVLGIRMLAEYVRGSRELKRENDLFI